MKRWAAIALFCLLSGQMSAWAEDRIPMPIDVDLPTKRVQITAYLSNENVADWQLDSGEFVDKVSPLVLDSIKTKLVKEFMDTRIVASDLKKLGWSANFDEDMLIITIDIPAEQLEEIDIPFGGYSSKKAYAKNVRMIEPSPVSGVFNFYYTHTHNLDDTSQYSDSLALRTGIALGPLTLEDGHTFSRNSMTEEMRIQRDASRLMYDLPNNYGFIQVGDYYSDTQIQQLNPGDIFGLSYSYQPQYLRDYYRPNSVPIVLESTSIVTIKINGEDFRRIRLAPGQYNLRDLPIDNGVNEVEVSYIDQGGSEVVKYYNLVNVPEILLAGSLETQWTAGYVQYYNDEGVKELNDEVPAAQMVLSYGLTSWWTISPKVEWQQDVQDYNLLHNFAVGDNFLTLETGLKQTQESDFYKGKVSYYLPETAWGALNNTNISYEYSYQEPIIGYQTQQYIRFSTGLNLPMKNGYMSFNGYSRFDDNVNVENSLALNTSYRLWDYLSLGLNLRWKETNGDSEESFAISANIPISLFDQRFSVSSRYDSNKEHSENALSFYHYGLDQSWRGTVNLRDQEYDGADFYYKKYGDYLNGNIRLSSNNEIDTENRTRVGSVGLETGIAFSGTNVAWTSPVSSGFSIVTLDDKDDDYRLVKNDYGRVSIVPKAQGGSKSLVTEVSNRRERLIEVNTRELAFDKELEFSQFVVKGGLRRGSSVNLEMIKGLLVSGQLEVQGKPLVDVVGEFVSEDGSRSFPFYTGMQGEFELDMIPKGQYELSFYDEQYQSQTVYIDDAQSVDGMFVQLDPLTVKVR
ncbi:fimbria/pilus outer membrane usher protein [Vibrio rumoiensis]|uniref:hypothetical protein n=1 Tax=Vibrio rumoiensis TaxID=76258 RepID=UPI000D7847A7|nr:hypothetical protein [Vibrio rumoiensis]